MGRGGGVGGGVRRVSKARREERVAPLGAGRFGFFGSVHRSVVVGYERGDGVRGEDFAAAEEPELYKEGHADHDATGVFD